MSGAEQTAATAHRAPSGHLLPTTHVSALAASLLLGVGSRRPRSRPSQEVRRGSGGGVSDEVWRGRGYGDLLLLVAGSRKVGVGVRVTQLVQVG